MIADLSDVLSKVDEQKRRMEREGNGLVETDGIKKMDNEPRHVSPAMGVKSSASMLGTLECYSGRQPKTKYEQVRV